MDSCNLMTSVLVKDRTGDKNMREEAQVRMDAQTGAMQPQAKGCAEPEPGGDAQCILPPELLEGAWPCGYLDFGLPTSRNVKK